MPHLSPQSVRTATRKSNRPASARIAPTSSQKPLHFASAADLIKDNKDIRNAIISAHQASHQASHQNLHAPRRHASAPPRIGLIRHHQLATLAYTSNAIGAGSDIFRPTDDQSLDAPETAPETFMRSYQDELSRSEGVRYLPLPKFAREKMLNRGPIQNTPIGPMTPGSILRTWVCVTSSFALIGTIVSLIGATLLVTEWWHVKVYGPPNLALTSVVQYDLGYHAWHLLGLGYLITAAEHFIGMCYSLAASPRVKFLGVCGSMVDPKDSLAEHVMDKLVDMAVPGGTILGWLMWALKGTASNSNKYPRKSGAYNPREREYLAKVAVYIFGKTQQDVEDFIRYIGTPKTQDESGAQRNDVADGEQAAGSETFTQFLVTPTQVYREHYDYIKDWIADANTLQAQHYRRLGEDESENLLYWDHLDMEIHGSVLWSCCCGLKCGRQISLAATVKRLKESWVNRSNKSRVLCFRRENPVDPLLFSMGVWIKRTLSLLNFIGKYAVPVVYAYPEWAWMPHGYRHMLLMVSDLLLSVTLFAAGAPYDDARRQQNDRLSNRSSTTSSADPPPYSSVYANWMHDQLPYTLFYAVSLRIVFMLVLVLRFDKCNACYWCPVGRCGNEYGGDAMTEEDKRQQELLDTMNKETRAARNMGNVRGTVFSNTDAEAGQPSSQTPGPGEPASAGASFTRLQNATRCPPILELHFAAPIRAIPAGQIGEQYVSLPPSPSSPPGTQTFIGYPSRAPPPSSQLATNQERKRRLMMTALDLAQRKINTASSVMTDSKKDESASSNVQALDRAQSQIAKGSLTARTRVLLAYGACLSCCARDMQTVGGNRIEQIRQVTCNGFTALFQHNWLGAVRMHVNFASFFMLGASFCILASSRYGDSAWVETNRFTNVSWPAYVRRTPLAMLPSYEEYVRKYLYARNYAPNPPPYPSPPLPPPPLPAGSTPAVPPPAQWGYSPPPPPPNPSPPPPSPPPPPAPPHPPFPPPYTTPVLHADVWPPLTEGGLPYPEDVDEYNDTSAWMSVAAGLIVVSELFRMLSSAAYVWGVFVNEAAIPSSHTSGDASPNDGTCLACFP